MHTPLIRKALLGAALTLAGCFASAQSTTQGAISGTVQDTTGAVVPGSTINIHNDGTNADIKLTADSSGYFKAPQLAPGTYTVTITSDGFSESRTTNVIVTVNSVTEVMPRLQTGATTAVVEVTADNPVIKLDTPSYGAQLSNTEIEAIPINNRRWSSLTLLTPGVTNDTSGFGLISFRAIAATLNNVLIDGADDNQAYYGEERGRTRAGYSTSQVAIREFQVNTGVYSAEFGRAVGGVVNSVTKSGSNTLHGEVYFYHRGEEWGASNQKTTRVAYDASTATASVINFKPKDKRNQYGFGLGGPLIKDKLFWFYAFDVFHRNFPGTAAAGNTSFYNDVVANDTSTANTYAKQDQNNMAAMLTRDNGATYTTAQALAIYRSFIQQMNGDLGPVYRYGH